jgi:hypothetical protein
MFCLFTLFFVCFLFIYLFIYCVCFVLFFIYLIYLFVLFIYLSSEDGRGKFHPIIYNEGKEGEQKYSFIVSLTLALEGEAPSDLPPTKGSRYALYRSLGWSQGWSGRVRKNSPPQWDSIPGPSSP